MNWYSCKYTVTDSPCLNERKEVPGYAYFYQYAMSTTLKKMLIVFKPRRGGILVAKNKGLLPSYF